MRDQKTVEVLNTLITINNDRIEGYETASKETEEHDLKSLFARFISTSQKCKQELIAEVSKLGGTATEGTMTSGKFFRLWMEVKAAITSKDRKAILGSCEFGEDVAEQAYDKVLENELAHLSAEQYEMIDTQLSLLQSDQHHIKALHDALVDA